MRVLVTWSSKRGGTEGIGQLIGEELRTRGLEVVASSVESVHAIESFDAVIVGGALYGNRWPRKLRSFVNHHLSQLRKVPVWFFSSGPLDECADREPIPATRPVAILAERIGAKGHVTFGGRLEPSAKGFPASAMAKTHSGDWRNPDRIRAWAANVAIEIPKTKPGSSREYPAHSFWRWFTHAVVGWTICAAMMIALLKITNTTTAIVIHDLMAPVVFVLIAWHYFRAPGARDPLPTAFLWTGIVAFLDLTIIAGLAQHSFDMFKSFSGVWLPLGLIFMATWAVGEVISTMPATKNTASAAEVGDQ
ncbi:MAG TPA: flavodoxin domain-containing protein [Bryobacteraceae bacterium]|nr:flavodoxin domain-containing protein [Bryobacteraceae bacterium]